MSRPLRLSVWLVPAGVTLVYVATLGGILAQDTDSPRQLVVAFLGLSLLAGIAIKRFYVLLLPISVVVLSLVSVHRLDEDPIVAMVFGLMLGVVLARAYERTESAERLAPATSTRTAPVARGLRRFVRRDRLDDVIDRVRFRVDTFPRGLYQPVGSLPARSARRGAGSESRWEAMFPFIRQQQVASAVDIGAAEGYFAIRLGQSGIPAIAIESNPPAYRTALFAVRRSGVEDVGVLALDLTPDNVVSMPSSDCTLCLSVWHHFVRAHGLDGATEMLETIWERTGNVLFFDTGENEMTPDFGLPEMLPDARSWIGAYLAETCEGSRVEHLGMHAAFDPSGRPCERNLFAVIRV